MTSRDVTADALRQLVFSIALRMVGSAGEAEDLVQEAYLRLHREGDVRAPKAFLTTVVTRLAIDHLNDPRLTLAEVAWLLGYSEHSAFTRAFRRWTGESPQQWRSRQPARAANVARG